MSQHETLDGIRWWAIDTFGGTATTSRIIERAQEEMVEALAETDLDAQIIEAADVVITLANLPGLQDAIDRKMAKNRARTWNVQPDGTAYHVKEGAE